MIEKEGTEGEEEARRAYRAAREESNHAAEAAAGERVSSALVDKVGGSFLHLRLNKLIYVLGNILYSQEKYVVYKA
jgi:hypothetical protein